MTRISRRRTFAAVPVSIFALACTLVAAEGAQAQASHDEQEVLLLEATPLGALPPIPLAMPASRNHNYWGFRLQAGRRDVPGGSDLSAVAGGIDFQYQGGSVIGITGGYQKRDCKLLGSNCGGHALFGVRSRINVVTGGQAVGSLFGDYSSTTTLGVEGGLGYAPNVLPEMNACTLDFGLPVTVSLGQRLRIASFLTPGVMWDMNCSGTESPSRPNYLTGLGFGLQQLRHRGLDVYLGLQKIFRRGTGYQVGISVTFVRLP
jgi:hypothetical protein